MVPDTKTRILQTALSQYNENGVYNPHGEQVTARSIAAALKMSDGNLRYHFPTREDILRGLYDQFSDRLNLITNDIPLGKADWKAWLQGFGQVYELMYAYRFLFRDVVGIMQHQPELNVHFTFLKKERRKMFGQMLQTLQYQGYLRPEPGKGQFERLYEQLQLHADFWVANAALSSEEHSNDRCLHATVQTFSLFAPYLSVIGLDKWQQALDEVLPV
ncbi:MAG: TetR/AcrR family transcriptional regulator [Bacteroidia bacterium]|nr:TetR/AcrR family transcriptional regulator [Bacteroidia bacterium]